jgi:hypothetical protein
VEITSTQLWNNKLTCLELTFSASALQVKPMNANPFDLHMMEMHTTG